MKLYKNSILSMLIHGCSDCPHRVAQRYKNGIKYSTGWVCDAISIAHKNPISGLEIAAHPSVKEAMVQGGALDECPLENHPF